jgi:hypothetical protein
MFSSKNILDVFLIKYFCAKNGIFGDFLPKKCGQPSVFSAVFVYFGWLWAYLPQTPCTTTPFPGTSTPMVGAPSRF